jgi:cytoskeleton protein RodZ
MADDLHMGTGDQGADRSGSRVGALLRSAREATGSNLQSVSQQLRIRAVYLRAIEEGDFGALPGTTYAVGFVRSYADFLGLDGPDIVRRFREEVEELGRRTQLVFPATPAEGKIPGGAIVLIAILIAGIVYGTWFYMSDRERSLAGLIPEVPAELRNLLSTAAPAPAGTPSTTVSNDNPTIQPPAPAPVESTGSAAATSTAPAEANTAETTAGVATAADEQAAAAITLAPASPSSTANPDEDEVPPAPDDADAATDAASEGQSGTGGAQGTADQEIVEAPPTPDTAQGEAPIITTPTTATTTPAPSMTETQSGATAAPAAVATTPTTTQEAAPPAPPPAPAVTEGSLPRGQDYGVTNGEARVVLVARQEAWVQVSGANQEVWTRVLRPGDRYLVPNDPTLTLSTGNAGGLDILVDGKKVSSLGPVGVVRRGISLDPQRLLGGAGIP